MWIACNCGEKKKPLPRLTLVSPRMNLTIKVLLNAAIIIITSSSRQVEPSVTFSTAVIIIYWTVWLDFSFGGNFKFPTTSGNCGFLVFNIKWKVLKQCV
jgi:hypothetical protein